MCLNILSEDALVCEEQDTRTKLVLNYLLNKSKEVFVLKAQREGQRYDQSSH